jgi:hypothetical protein
MKNPDKPKHAPRSALAVDPSGNLLEVRIVENHSTATVNGQVVKTVEHTLKPGWRWANEEEIARHDAAQEGTTNV